MTTHYFYTTQPDTFAIGDVVWVMVHNELRYGRVIGLRVYPTKKDAFSFPGGVDIPTTKAHQYLVWMLDTDVTAGQREFKCYPKKPTGIYDWASYLYSQPHALLSMFETAIQILRENILTAAQKITRTIEATQQPEDIVTMPGASYSVGQVVWSFWKDSLALRISAQYIMSIKYSMPGNQIDGYSYCNLFIIKFSPTNMQDVITYEVGESISKEVLFQNETDYLTAEDALAAIVTHLNANLYGVINQSVEDIKNKPLYA